LRDLYQYLRQIGRDDFEVLIHQYLLAKYPGAGIKKVDGSGGDEGLDSFKGELKNGPAVWQAKYFHSAIGNSQKAKILESLERALSLRELSTWTLCLPKDFTTLEHKWFQASVQERYNPRCAICLINASDLVNELLVNRRLCDSMFPDNALSNIVKLREMTVGTENKTLSEREEMTLEHAQQLLEQYSEIEPRLVPHLVIGPGAPRQAGHPGVILSKIRPTIRFDFSARDEVAYKADPIHAHFSVTQEHSQLFEEALDKGLPLVLPAGSILRFSSTTPLMDDLARITQGLELRIDARIPPELASRHFPVKLICGKGDDSREVPYVDLVLTRFGRREVELQSQDKSPLAVTLMLAFEEGLFGKCEVGLQLNLASSDVSAASSILYFIDEFERSKDLRIVSLEYGDKLAWQLSDVMNPLSIPKQQADLIHQAAAVAKFFNVPLTIPTELRESDLRNIKTLYRIATGEEFTDIRVNMPCQKEKEGPLTDEAIQWLLSKDISGHIETNDCLQVLKVFDREIPTGRVAMDVSGCELESFEEFRVAYHAAGVGTALLCPLLAKGPCRMWQLSPPSEDRQKDPDTPVQGRSQ
jgi:hypothetical protein